MSHGNPACRGYSWLQPMGFYESQIIGKRNWRIQPNPGLPPHLGTGKGHFTSANEKWLKPRCNIQFQIFGNLLTSTLDLVANCCQTDSFFMWCSPQQWLQVQKQTPHKRERRPDTCCRKSRLKLDQQDKIEWGNNLVIMLITFIMQDIDKLTPLPTGNPSFTHKVGNQIRPLSQKELGKFRTPNTHLLVLNSHNDSYKC